MDKITYAILNKKIKNSGGGSGGTAVYVQNCKINDDGYLIITLSDGSIINAGLAKGNSPTITTNEIENGVEILVDGVSIAEIYNGEQGLQGEKGEKGEQGNNGISPTIEVYTNTTSTYQLKINNADGTSIITPNLLGAGASTTRYYIFDNAMYLNYTETIYTIYNGEMKSLQDYIDAGAEFCNATNNYALFYGTGDFGWNGQATSFNTVSMLIEPTQFVLYGYISGAIKSGEFFKFIPAELVTGSTNQEKAESIKSLLDAENENIITIDFEYVYATNGVTEAVSLESVLAGEYYIVWSGTSDNSRPKINDITIM